MNSAASKYLDERLAAAESHLSVELDLKELTASEKIAARGLNLVGSASVGAHRPTEQQNSAVKEDASWDALAKRRVKLKRGSVQAGALEKK